MKKIILGQEVICPDGLGRVSEFSSKPSHTYIRVDTYVANRGCKWAPHNVTLIMPGTGVRRKTIHTYDHVICRTEGKL